MSWCRCDPVVLLHIGAKPEQAMGWCFQVCKKTFPWSQASPVAQGISFCFSEKKRLKGMENRGAVPSPCLLEGVLFN